MASRATSTAWPHRTEPTALVCPPELMIGSAAEVSPRAQIGCGAVLRVQRSVVLVEQFVYHEAGVYSTITRHGTPNSPWAARCT